MAWPASSVDGGCEWYTPVRGLGLGVGMDLLATQTSRCLLNLCWGSLLK